jgi:hypothetical protein
MSVFFDKFYENIINLHRMWFTIGFTSTFSKYIDFIERNTNILMATLLGNPNA